MTANNYWFSLFAYQRDCFLTFSDGQIPTFTAYLYFHAIVEEYHSINGNYKCEIHIEFLQTEHILTHH